ncbi:MAG TPA: hypothetical protein VIJ61_05040 [Thermoanaerobaculia bacterium]
MNANQHPRHPDRLREILRQGDPAAQETGLTLDEAHTMRRAVLTAAPESRRRMAWFPIMATGAAALLALALAVAFGPWHRTPAPAPPAPVRMAAVPAPRVAPPIPLAPATIPVKIRPARRHPVRAPKALSIHRDDSPMLTASLPVREIQFSTPGGTRVIWELSGKDSR